MIEFTMLKSQHGVQQKIMLESMDIWRNDFIFIPNAQYKKDIRTEKKVFIYKEIPASKMWKTMSLVSNLLSK